MGSRPRVECAMLSRLAREGLTQKVTFEQRLEGQTVVRPRGDRGPGSRDSPAGRASGDTSAGSHGERDATQRSSWPPQPPARTPKGVRPGEVKEARFSAKLWPPMGQNTKQILRCRCRPFPEGICWSCGQVDCGEPWRRLTEPVGGGGPARSKAAP